MAMVNEAFEKWAKDADEGVFASEREIWQSAFLAGAAHGAQQERAAQEVIRNGLFGVYCYLCERGHVPERNIRGHWMHKQAAMHYGASYLRERCERRISARTGEQPDGDGG